MGSIQGGTALVSSTVSNNLAITLTNIQTLVIKSTGTDAHMAYSETELDNSYSRLIIEGSASHELILTFPHFPFTGTLWFRSADAVTESEISVWSVKCGNEGY